MKHKPFYIVILFFLLLFSINSWGDGTWRYPWLPMAILSGWFFNDVHFTQPQRGWLVGSSIAGDAGFIAHTDGNGWEVQLQVPHLRLGSVQFLTDMKGWAAGWRKIESGGTEGALFYTQDGGRHWEESHQFQWNIYQIQFVTEQRGWAVGHALDVDRTSRSVILATIDGGKNWAVQYEGVNEVLDNGISFADANNGWVSGSAKGNDSPGILLHTGDGGENWIHLPVERLLPGEWIKAVKFISAQEGWLVSFKRAQDEHDTDTTMFLWTIFHTQNGGQTWKAQKTVLDERVWTPTISFADGNQGWVTVGGNILHTVDGGNTWIDQNYRFIVDDTEVMFWPGGMNFLDNQRGWIVGFGGILMTSDGGDTWLQEQQQMPFGYRHMNDIIFVTPEKGWAVGDDGGILHTADGGLSWEAQESSVSVELLGVHFASTQEGWVVGDEGAILYTVNGGNTWKKQDSGTKTILNDVQFVDTQEGWVVGGELISLNVWSKTILHTVDGGHEWETVRNAPVEYCLTDVHFVNPQIGWFAGGINVFHTEDGGKNWQEQLHKAGALWSGGYRAIYFLDALTGWLVDRHYIAHTTNGGHTWKVQYDSGDERLRDLYFANRDEGWVVGRWNVLHTEDGGQTWSSGPEIGLNSICYGGPGTLWGVDNNGLFLKYTDPDLRAMQPTYWAVEPSGKGITAWGDVKNQEHLSGTSMPVLTDGLLQNYPNPFNPETWIPYQLAEDSEVTIRIYSVAGQLVRVLDLGHREAGSYVTRNAAAHWDGRNEAGEQLASDLYFYTIQADDFVATKKMIVLR